MFYIDIISLTHIHQIRNLNIKLNENKLIKANEKKEETGNDRDWREKRQREN